MEPVILIVAVTAILSGTYIRSKKIGLEKERLRLMAGRGEFPAERRKKRRLFQKAKQAIPNISVNTKDKDEEITELKKRLENLETIVVGELDTHLMNGTAQHVQQELKNISNRLDKLDS